MNATDEEKTVSIGKFCPLASGSKGNCIYLESDKCKMLIDAGLSAREITKKLNEINVNIDDIDAILITHEHRDHIQGLKVLALKNNIPILANKDTAMGISNFLKKTPQFKIFFTGEQFEFADMTILPFSIPHDAADPIGLRITMDDQIILGICTDLGFISNEVMKNLQNVNYLYIESNHKTDMVYASQLPSIYKRRVLSNYGHLSNEECARFIGKIHSPQLRQIYLAHISSECNTPETAHNYVSNYLQSLGLSIPIALSLQTTPSPIRNMINIYSTL